ncbi:hypothetical protein SADUNF_Sadunf03G0130000 [Salix dunnii]|uniref:SBP-type domain-containing protein n=1 Tax=Salix dunnii TaxID=1413687 RepID=A0A835N4M5_9ROSI|nr:hypothetical protein SADUNF_Sadunf03G0130000 [Salix dunnii]
MALPLGKLTILVGAGPHSRRSILGSVLAKEGRLPDVSNFVSGAFKIAFRQLKRDDSTSSVSKSSKPPNDSLMAQVSSLRQELQMLASSRQVTIVTANGTGANKYGVAVVVVVVGYGYVWWKGWKLPDMMFATRRSLSDACTSIAQQLENVYASIRSTRRHLSSKINDVDSNLNAVAELTASTQEKVIELREDSSRIGNDVRYVRDAVETLDLTTQGVKRLCDYASSLENNLLEENIQACHHLFTSSSSSRLTFSSKAGALPAPSSEPSAPALIGSQEVQRPPLNAASASSQQVKLEFQEVTGFQWWLSLLTTLGFPMGPGANTPRVLAYMRDMGAVKCSRTKQIKWKLEPNVEATFATGCPAFLLQSEFLVRERMEIVKPQWKKPPPSANAAASTLPLYCSAPSLEVRLEDFELYAIDRLRVLKGISDGLSRGKRPEEMDKLVNDLWKAHMGHPLQSEVTNKDIISHFVLRLVYCRTEELRKWFLSNEIVLFRYRFRTRSPEAQRLLMAELDLPYKPVTTAEFEGVEEKLHLVARSIGQPKPTGKSRFGCSFHLPPTHTGPFTISKHRRSLQCVFCSDCNPVSCSPESLPADAIFYKVPFEEVPELVAGRRVFIYKGYAYVAMNQVVSLVATQFRGLLSKALVLTNRSWKPYAQAIWVLTILRFFVTLNMLISAAFRSHSQVNHEEFGSHHLQPKEFAELREDHHLKHGGRMQLGLFLKGVGLKLDDALAFWKAEFSQKVGAERFDKEYAYGIRHNYGREGKRTDYTPYSCQKIISSTPGVGDNHGCPYRHFSCVSGYDSEENLKAALSKMGVNSGALENVMDKVSECEVRFKVVLVRTIPLDKENLWATDSAVHLYRFHSRKPDTPFFSNPFPRVDVTKAVMSALLPHGMPLHFQLFNALVCQGLRKGKDSINWFSWRIPHQNLEVPWCGEKDSWCGRRPNVPVMVSSGLEQQSSPHSTQITVSCILRLPRATGYCSVDLKLGSSGDFRDKYRIRGTLQWNQLHLNLRRELRHLKMQPESPHAWLMDALQTLPNVGITTGDIKYLYGKSEGKDLRFSLFWLTLQNAVDGVWFHSLGEFDDGKRSCRKRLDGHNRRRRKPQPEPLSLNSASIFSNQGTRYLHFGSSQILSTSAMNTVWTGAAKAGSGPTLYTSESSMNFGGRKNLFPGSLSFNYKEGKQFPFLQGTCSKIPEDSVHLDASSTLGNSGNSEKMFSDGLNRAIDSSRVLSLLSSPPSETREIGLSDIMQPDLNSPAQSLIPSLNYNALGMDSEPSGFVLVSDGSSCNANGQHMFQIGPDGSSANGSHQTLSFSWE